MKFLFVCGVPDGGPGTGLETVPCQGKIAYGGYEGEDDVNTAEYLQPRYVD